MFQKIKKLCATHNISVSTLEKTLGFARGSLFKWYTNVPSITKVKAVADYFGITIEELLSDEN